MGRVGSRDINMNVNITSNNILLQDFICIFNGHYYCIKPTIVALHRAMWTYTPTKLPAYIFAKEVMTATMNYGSGSHSYSSP
jgi:hypothetical protein